MGRKKKQPIKRPPTILEEAQHAVYGDRQADYGSVTQNFNNIAGHWSIILKHSVTPEQVGMCMIALKIARNCHVSKRDNIVDIAGYAATIEKLNNGQ